MKEPCVAQEQYWEMWGTKAHCALYLSWSSQQPDISEADPASWPPISIFPFFFYPECLTLPSTWLHSWWLYSPASWMARHGHVTKFQPRNCERKSSVPFLGRAFKRNRHMLPLLLCPLLIGWHTAMAEVGGLRDKSCTLRMAELPNQPCHLGLRCFVWEKYIFTLFKPWYFGGFLFI